MPKQELIDEKLQNLNQDGIDRRGFLKCMAWAGTGLVWTVSAGIPKSRAFGKDTGRSAAKGGDFSFVQISDSHIGFDKPANPDVTATLQAAIGKINAMAHTPDFIIHTGFKPSFEAWRIRYSRSELEKRVRQADLFRARGA